LCFDGWCFSASKSWALSLSMPYPWFRRCRVRQSAALPRDVRSQTTVVHGRRCAGGDGHGVGATVGEALGHGDAEGDADGDPHPGPGGPTVGPADELDDGLGQGDGDGSVLVPEVNTA